MTVPSFVSRASDALQAVFTDKSREELQARLQQVRVKLVAPQDLSVEGAHATAFVFAANLFARLYGAIEVVGGEALARAARDEIFAINPMCDFEPDDGAITLRFGTASDELDVAVWARGWNVLLDDEAPASADDTAEPAAALAAAAVGVGEVFRVAFADWLGEDGRTGRQPGSLNLITLTEADDGPIPIGSTLDLGTFHLVGCGAIGQASVATLAASDVQGEVVLVDHEAVELSNLQRYVLSSLGDVGAAKTAVVAQKLAATQLHATEVQVRWGETNAVPPVDTVLTALDSGRDRIAVQSGLPRRIYNAGTHPADLGWSRHEHFGVQPCLACMYLPTADVPSRHEEIGKALGQPPARILGYLMEPLRVSQPLAAEKIMTLRPLPTDDEGRAWSAHSLLDDLVAGHVIEPTQRARWSEATIEALYTDGVCGGGILITSADLPSEVLVPMAHQSAFAGIMLATQLLAASSDELREFRPEAPEGRFNVLVGFPQQPTRPRVNLTDDCLCADPDYVGQWNKSWVGTVGGAVSEADEGA
jgi:hypothetical protein